MDILLWILATIISICLMTTVALLILIYPEIRTNNRVKYKYEKKHRKYESNKYRNNKYNKKR